MNGGINPRQNEQLRYEWRISAQAGLDLAASQFSRYRQVVKRQCQSPSLLSPTAFFTKPIRENGDNTPKFEHLC